MGSRSSSRVSDGMNSYFRKNAAQNETSAKLNPHASEYLPDQMQCGHGVFMQTESSSEQQVVRPKTTHGSVKAHDMNTPAQYSPQRPNVQTHVQKGVPLVVNDGNQGDIYNIIQRQNDITALLVQQNLSSTFPPRDIPVYDDDPLQFEVFIRAFERGVERKTDDYGVCSHYLEQ